MSDRIPKRGPLYRILNHGCLEINHLTRCETATPTDMVARWPAVNDQGLLLFHTLKNVIIVKTSGHVGSKMTT